MKTRIYYLDNGWEVKKSDGKYILKIHPIKNSLFKKKKEVEITNEIFQAIENGEVSIKELFKKYKLQDYLVNLKKPVQQIKKQNTETKFYKTGFILEKDGNEHYLDYQLSKHGGGNERIKISETLFLEAKEKDYQLSDILKIVKSNLKTNILLKQALNEKKLFEFLVGREDYKIVNTYADTPTNSIEALSSITYYYKTTGDFTIWKDFNNALEELIKDENLVWFSLYYLYDILRLTDCEDWIQEYIEVANLMNQIESHLRLFKNSLSANKSWVGREYEYGLWGDVLRLKNNIFDSFGIDLNLTGNSKF